MRKKLCQSCHKKPIEFMSRKDKNSPTIYLCGSCAEDYLPWGIVSYNRLLDKELLKELE